MWLVKILGSVTCALAAEQETSRRRKLRNLIENLFAVPIFQSRFQAGSWRITLQ
jgi:hypothetical protein